MSARYRVSTLVLALAVLAHADVDHDVEHPSASCVLRVVHPRNLSRPLLTAASLVIRLTCDAPLQLPVCVLGVPCLHCTVSLQGMQRMPNSIA